MIGNGGAVARDNKQPYSTEGEMVSPLTKARSAKIGSDSDHQRGVNPYESNPPKADYLVYIFFLCDLSISKRKNFFISQKMLKGVKL